MNTKTFLTLFQNNLHSSASLSNRWGDQSRFIGELLHLAGHDNEYYCCCSKKFCEGHDDIDADLPTRMRGEHQEFLFDLTWYRDWTYWRQPEVIIEHENATGINDFMRDLWKLMFGYAPLRVMIGYAPDAFKVKHFIDQVSDHAHKAQWHFPNTTEDLVLIGYKRGFEYASPDEFRVLYRAAGEKRFVDLGRLCQFALSEDNPE